MGRRVTNILGLLLLLAQAATAQNVWNGSSVSTVTTNGKVGIGITNPATELHVKGAIRLQNRVEFDKTVFLGFNESGDFTFLTSWDAATSTPQDLVLSGRFIGIGTLEPQTKLHVVGTTRTDVLEITGGSDLAEPFDIRGDRVEPGMVVSIDPDRPGQLRVASSPYDKTVAGVVSGAGGVRPGMVMGQQGTIAHGAHPVALSGRVFALADASVAPIEPGDLLTTSSRPGYAMKVVDPERAPGAVIGKAMTRLDDGQGTVLVLVSLQ